VAHFTGNTSPPAISGVGLSDANVQYRQRQNR
jgi:hypothetical protein